MNGYVEHIDSAHLTSYNRIDQIYRFHIVNRKPLKISKIRLSQSPYESGTKPRSQLLYGKLNFTTSQYFDELE